MALVSGFGMGSGRRGLRLFRLLRELEELGFWKSFEFQKLLLSSLGCCVLEFSHDLL